MFDLTPSERRGVLVLVALVAIGAAADLLRLAPVAAPEPPELPAVSAPPAAAAAAPEGPTTSPAGKLDLNAATVAELDRLPGIGPVLAGRIVAHREAHGALRRVDELLAVPGIGPRLFSRLEPLVEVRAPRDSNGSAVQIARPRAE